MAMKDLLGTLAGADTADELRQIVDAGLAAAASVLAQAAAHPIAEALPKTMAAGIRRFHAALEAEGYSTEEAMDITVALLARR